MYCRAHTPAPLIIRVERDEHGIRLRLDDASVNRLRSSFGPRMAVTAVTVDYDTLKAFEQLHGPIYEHVISVVTGLDNEQLTSFGGVQVIDQSGRILAHQ